MLAEGWIIRNVGTWDFEKELIGLRETDTNAHIPIFIHLQQYLTSRSNRRSEEAVERRRWRNYYNKKKTQNTWR